jgi:hypothetical protein
MHAAVPLDASGMANQVQNTQQFSGQQGLQGGGVANFNSSASGVANFNSSASGGNDFIGVCVCVCDIIYII